MGTLARPADAARSRKQTSVHQQRRREMTGYLPTTIVGGIHQAIPYETAPYQAVAYDYEPIGPARNEVPWFDLLVFAILVLAAGVVVHGVVGDLRRTWRAWRNKANASEPEISP